MRAFEKKSDELLINTRLVSLSVSFIYVPTVYVYQSEGRTFYSRYEYIQLSPQSYVLSTVYRCIVCSTRTISFYRVTTTVSATYNSTLLAILTRLLYMEKGKFHNRINKSTYVYVDCTVPLYVPVSVWFELLC